MEFLICDDAFLLVDSSILGHACQLLVVQNAWDDWLAEQAVAFVVDDRGRQVVDALDLACHALEQTETSQVVIRLCEARVALSRSEIRVIGRAVDREREKDLIVNVNMSAKRLVRVESLQLAINNRDCALTSRIHELVVGLDNISVDLQSLHEVVPRERLEDLELLVPVTTDLWIESVQWHKSLAHLVAAWDDNTLLLRRRCEPVLINWLALSQEVRISFKDGVYESLQIASEALRQLGEAAHEGVAVARIASRRWVGVESALLCALVLVEAIDRACNHVLLIWALKSAHCQVKEVSLHLASSRHWVELRELNAIDALYVVQFVQAAERDGVVVQFGEELLSLGWLGLLRCILWSFEVLFFLILEQRVVIVSSFHKEGLDFLIQIVACLLCFSGLLAFFKLLTMWALAVSSGAGLRLAVLANFLGMIR
jgi:hypothetical protein